MDLVGKSAFVTGGSGGLGRQTCLALAEAGCDIVVGYCAGVDRVRAVQDAVSKTGRRAATVQLDQSDPDSVRRAVEDAVAAFDRLDILVNNAAGAGGVPIADLDALTREIWDWTMAANLRGPWLVAQAAAPHLAQTGHGRIVNVAAMAGMRPMGASIAQSVSKAAVIQLTKCLAVALAPRITVNCGAPGLMDGTELTRNLSDAFRDSFTSQSALGTTTSLADVAGQIVHFCRSETITGQTLVIDGGVHFH